METKVCKKCGVEKSLCEFNKDKYSKDGLRYRCRLCTSGEYKNFYYKNQKKEIERQTNYQLKNKDITKKNRNLRETKRRNNDLIYKIKISVRNRLKLFLKSKNFNTSLNKTIDFVGCTPNELKMYLEQQFKDGMSWENFGFYGWHIDHKIPISQAQTIEDVYRLSHYTNLQPLWANENYKKSNKII
jgi:hypothetical protein